MMWWSWIYRETRPARKELIAKQLLLSPTTACTLLIPYSKGLVVFRKLLTGWYFLGISTMKDEFHDLSIFFDICEHIPLLFLAVTHRNNTVGI